MGELRWYLANNWRWPMKGEVIALGVLLLAVPLFKTIQTIQMTKRYAHLAPAHNQAAVDRLVEFHAEPASASPSDTKTGTEPESHHDQILASVQ